jgi:SAM-dependent methyltransferase
MRPEHLLNLGYTPTHEAILSALAAALRPAGEGAIRLLDPCCGTGEALAALAQALRDQGARVETYGVELEEGRAAQAARVLDQVLRADFLEIALSERSMSLALLNPPYDHEGGEGSLEREIIRRGIEKIAPGGIAILLIPRRLLPWAGRFHFEWLALRTSPDPASPSQVILVGRRAAGPSALPPERPLEEGFPPVEVPALQGPAPRMYKPVLEEADIAPFLREGPSPRDLLAAEAGEEIHPLHPLRAGHRAAVLAAWRRTLALPGGRRIRVTVHHEVTVTEDMGEDGRWVRRVQTRPALAFWVLDRKGLRREPFERLAEWAEEIDAALRLRARVEERPDGWPAASPWEEAVLAEISSRLPPLGGRQGLLPAQAVRAVGMARALRAGERVVWGVMEMGYGKTPISLAVRALLLARRARPFLTVVLCPPHLVPKWAREAGRLAPGARVVVPEGDGVERLRAAREAVEAAAAGAEVILILSREAAKLGPLHRPALVPKFFGRDGWRWACPRCGAPAYMARRHEPDRPTAGILATEATFPAPPPHPEAAQRTLARLRTLAAWAQRDSLARAQRLRAAIQGLEESLRADPAPPERLLGRRCPRCLSPYAVPTPEPRRWPLADFLAREVRRRGVAMLLIADEVHEYRHASLQGRAFSRLLGAARWAVLLTGTPFGGKASELYRLLRLTSPEFRRTGLSEKEFTARFGRLEIVEAYEERRRYGRSLQGVRTKELPGVSPEVWRFLIGRTAFGSLQDVAAALPDYTEAREVLPAPDRRPELDPAMAGQIFHELGLGGLSVWLQAALGYYNAAAVPAPDGAPAHVYDFARLDPDGRIVSREVLFRLPVLPEAARLPKERRLVEIVRAEKAAGRKVVVLVSQTGRRPVAERLVRILREAGLRAEALDPAKVPPAEREEWILRKAPGLDALVVHPRAVETGLDLVMFQTAVLYEVAYSAVTLIQAIRRLWRLGQSQPVRVIALAYDHGLEVPAWDLVSRKVSWARTVYGDFAACGLGEAFDEDLDLLREIARRLERGEPLVGAGADGEGEAVTMAGIVRPMAPAPIPAPVVPPAAPDGPNGRQPPEEAAEVLALPPDLAGLPLFRAASGGGRDGRNGKAAVPAPEPVDLTRAVQGRLF